MFQLNSRKMTVALVLVIALSACNQAAPPPADAPGATAPANAESATTAQPVQAPPSEFGETMLWLDPLAECAKDKQVGKIHWAATAVAEGPATIELGDKAGEGVFARIGAEGEKETGDWAAPGQAIVLRGADGKVRARQIFKGPNGCVQ